MNTNPLEKAIEAKLGKYAKSKNCLYKKFTSPSNRSVPDRIIVTPHGVVGFLELKRKGQKPTEQQRHELATLIEHGATASWVDNYEDGRQFVDDLLAGKPGSVFLQGRAGTNADELLMGDVM